MPTYSPDTAVRGGGDAPPESPGKHTWRFFPLNWAPPPAETDHAAAAQGLHCSVPQWNPELSWHGTSLLSSALYCGLVAPSETDHEHHNTAAGRGAYTTKPLSLSAKHGVPYLVGNPHPTRGTCYGPSSSWLLSAREARAEPPTGGNARSWSPGTWIRMTRGHTRLAAKPRCCRGDHA